MQMQHYDYITTYESLTVTSAVIMYMHLRQTLKALDY